MNFPTPFLSFPTSASEKQNRLQSYQSSPAAQASSGQLRSAAERWNRPSAPGPSCPVPSRCGKRAARTLAEDEAGKRGEMRVGRSEKGRGGEPGVGWWASLSEHGLVKWGPKLVPNAVGSSGSLRGMTFAWVERGENIPTKLPRTSPPAALLRCPSLPVGAGSGERLHRSRSSSARPGAFPTRP